MLYSSPRDRAENSNVFRTSSLSWFPISQVYQHKAAKACELMICDILREADPVYDFRGIVQSRDPAVCAFVVLFFFSGDKLLQWEGREGVYKGNRGTRVVSNHTIFRYTNRDQSHFWSFRKILENFKIRSWTTPASLFVLQHLQVSSDTWYFFFFSAVFW